MSTADEIGRTLLAKYGIPPEMALDEYLFNPEPGEITECCPSCGRPRDAIGGPQCPDC